MRVSILQSVQMQKCRFILSAISNMAKTSIPGKGRRCAGQTTGSGPFPECGFHS